MATTRDFGLQAFAAQPISLRRLLLAIGLLSLAAYCAFAAYLAVAGSARLLRNPYDNTDPESSQLYAAVQGARTGRIYLPLDSSPYVVQPYGPLFYLVNMAVARAAHLSLDAARLALRALAFASFLGCGLLAFLILRKMKLSPPAALLAALALLAQPDFVTWNVTIRPDILCLLLMLVCLYFAVGEDEDDTGHGRRALWLSGLFGGLAFLVKQPGVAAPLAVGVVLLLRKEFRRLCFLVLAAALPVVAVFALLLVRRESFLEQFTSVGKNLWSLAGGAHYVAVTVDLPLFLALAVAAVALPRALRAGKRAQILAAFFLLSLALGLSGMPQVGADVNYYLPPLAASALLLPFCLQEFEKRLTHPAVLAPVTAIVVFALWSSLSAAVAAGQSARQGQLPRRSDTFAALAPFHILSDRPFFTVHGRDPELLDPFTLHGLEVAGHWSSAPVADELRRSGYDLVILACSGGGRAVCNWRGLAYFSPAIVQAIDENYAVFCSTLSTRVLVPRSRAVVVTPQMFALALGRPCGVAMQGKPPALVFPPSFR